LLGGPVGPPEKWAATSNVEVSQTTCPIDRDRYREGEGENSGGEGRREWNRGGVPGTLC